jgi:hypothetical protein
MRERDNSEFCIQIDFQKESEKPARVFKAMTGLIEAFEEIDRNLVRSIDVQIESVLLLEDIEAGSIRAWFRNQLIAHDDKDIQNLNWKPVIGKYLVTTKYILIDFLSNKTEISDRAQLQNLQGRLLEAAEETNMKAIPAYAPLALPEVIKSINSVNSALTPLLTTDSAKFLTKDAQTNFNIQLRIAPETMEQLITKETITNEVEMILKVKRPDYLGDAMWEFRHETRTIPAKIIDLHWLTEFQARRVDVRPGDALRGRVRIEVEYGYDGEVVATHHAIVKVIAVVPAQEGGQGQLLPPTGA